MPFPIAAAAAAAVGGYFVYDQYKTNEARKLAAANRPQVPPILNQEGIPRKEIAQIAEYSSAAGQGTPAQAVTAFMNAPKPQPVQVAKSPGGNPIIAIAATNPSTGQPVVAAQVAVTGTARAEAQALYDFVMKNPLNAVTQPAELTRLVQAFQRAHNSDPNGIKVAGQLSLTGLYDLATSSALTVYTGNPIAPFAATPVVLTIGNGPSPATMAGNNLYAYLKTHKNVRTDAQLKALIMAFQKAVNTDPRFPGPANPNASVRIIKVALVVDGLYGPKSADALAVVAGERINP